MNFDVKTLAGEAVPILDIFEQFAPFLSGILSATPAAVAGPILVGVLGALDSGAKALAAGNNADAIDVLAGLTKHLVPGMTNTIAGSPAQTATPAA
jgi:hypothetical protein